MNAILRNLRAPALLGMVLLIGACQNMGMMPTQQKSLYDRLGGKDAIVAVVDDFVGNVAADNRINRYFAMRFDKFTTKFQQALADAQSLAVGNDNPFIEPQHLLLALLNQEDGGTASLLARAGVNVAALKAALKSAIDRLPKVERARAAK